MVACDVEPPPMTPRIMPFVEQVIDPVDGDVLDPDVETTVPRVLTLL
jgi:hypothetical protein